MVGSELAKIVSLRASHGRASALEKALRTLIVSTREEPGSVACLLHGSADDVGLFIVYERWRDEAAFAAHMATSHVANFLADADALLAEPAVISALEPLL